MFQNVSLRVVSSDSPAPCTKMRRVGESDSNSVDILCVSSFISTNVLGDIMVIKQLNFEHYNGENYYRVLLYLSNARCWPICTDFVSIKNWIWFPPIQGGELGRSLPPHLQPSI